MKVKYVSNDNKEPALSKNKIYYVVAIEYKKSGSTPSIDVKYRILNDMNQVIPYSAKMFEVLSNHLGMNWVCNPIFSDYYSLLPTEIAYKGFWEDFYNDDIRALELFESSYLAIIMEEASSDEVKELIMSDKEYEVVLILKGLLNTENRDFVQDVIKLVKKKISSFSVFSRLKITFEVIECFHYLSKMGGELVDELFIEYYENTEWQCGELNLIVNDFYSKQ